MLHGCVSREFANWATSTTSPITVWLRALARAEHARCGGPGVGAVGMCFTGGFALAMMVDDTVLAPVLSQPSLPFPVGKDRGPTSASPTPTWRVKARADDGSCVLGLRFTGDRLVPAERFQRLRDELGDGFRGRRDRLVARQPVGDRQKRPIRCSPRTSSTSPATPPARPSIECWSSSRTLAPAERQETAPPIRRPPGEWFRSLKLDRAARIPRKSAQRSRSIPAVGTLAIVRCSRSSRGGRNAVLRERPDGQMHGPRRPQPRRGAWPGSTGKAAMRSSAA